MNLNVETSMESNSSLSEFANFYPSAERVALLDHRVRSRLRSSLSYILEQLQDQVVVPAGMHTLLGNLHHAAVSPTIYAAYSDLVLATENGDRPEAERLLRFMASAPLPASTIELFPLRGDPSDERERLYQRYVDTDEESELLLVPLTESAETAFRQLFDAALQLMHDVCPGLWSEVQALLREVLVVGKSRDPTFEFDGASAFTLWGGIVLNGEGASTTLDVVQALAHESAHNLIFGLSMGNPLHETDQTKRFSSPLRADPRPMEGIIHATFVIARMHYAVQGIINANHLSGGVLEEANRAAKMHVRGFFHGMATIEQHAALTVFGKELFGSTKDYMLSVQSA